MEKGVRKEEPAGEAATEPIPVPVFTVKAVLTGTLLSLCIALGVPYGNMVIRGSYMAMDFSTAGAIFLFFLLVGIINVALGLISPVLALNRRDPSSGSCCWRSG